MRKDYYPPLAISIHGIRTHGEWQKVFAAVVSGSPSKVDSFDYGRYGLVRFLIPASNRHMADKFYDWYGNLIRSCPEVDLDKFDKRPSIVAHSLGSWIVGTAMLKFKDMRFDKIIFAGSILPRDFDWGLLFARDQVASVRNECGHKDPWPGWASRFVAKTGTGGAEGFEWFTSAVENVHCEWFSHSDALMRPHIEHQWIPFLRRAPSPLGILHGRDIQDGDEFAAILDHTGDVIDNEAYGALPNYHEVEIPRGLSLTWIKVNPDIYTFLIDRDSSCPAGYINAMPVDDDAYAEIRQGKLTDDEILADMILPYEGGPSAVKIYMMSIAIAGKYRRWGDGIFQQAYVQLIAGLLDTLIYYWNHHGVRVTHMMATAWTPEGRRLCGSLGMVEIGRDKFNDPIFEVDFGAIRGKTGLRLMPAMRRLIDAYCHLPYRI